jgi:hypothetical protein
LGFYSPAGDVIYLLNTEFWLAGPPPPPRAASSPLGTRVTFLNVKQSGHEADHSPLLMPKFKMCVAIPPLSHTSPVLN